MKVKAEWVINKAKEKIYAVSHSKAMTRGHRNVESDLCSIERFIDESNTLIDGSDVSYITHHSKQTLQDDEENGIHGIKYHNGELMYHNGTDWVVLCSTGEGFAPDDMKSVSVEEGDEGTQLVIRGVDPDDTVVGEIEMSLWGGTKVVRKVGSYPKNPRDGVLVVDYQIRNQYAVNGFIDSGLVTGEKYYYRWFPYSKTGVVNISEDTKVNRAMGVPRWPWTLGVEVDLENNTFTRTDDAVGLNAGDDFDDFRTYRNRRRCIVTDDKVILAFYGEPGYIETGYTDREFKVDGKVYPVGTNVQVMVYQPKFYYKVTPIKMVQTGSGQLIRSALYQIAEKPLTGFTIHPNFRRNNEDIPYVLYSAYEASSQKEDGNYIINNTELGSKLASVYGAKPLTDSNVGDDENAKGFSRMVARVLAQNRGSGWQLSDLVSLSATQLLFMIEYATMNAQEAIGKGNVMRETADYSGVISSGGTSSLGNKSGRDTSVEDGYGSVSYRGEENLWGNVWTWIDGANIKNNGIGSIYYTDHGYIDDTTRSPYMWIGTDITFRNDGYISAICYNQNCDFMFLPGEVKGDSINPIGDYVNQQFSKPYMTSAHVGGKCDDKLMAGLFNFGLSTKPEASRWSIGSRLLCLPNNTEIYFMPPPDMKYVAVIVGEDGNQLGILGSDPDDIVAGGNVIVKWKGTQVVRKVGSYPTSVEDGTLILDYQERDKYATTPFYDTGLTEGETYYYRWFPYSDKGVTNLSDDESSNRASRMTVARQVLGLQVDWRHVPYSTNWPNVYVRTDNAVGMSAGDDFDKYPMYGKRRRCIVADDRTILAFYGDDAFVETGKLKKAVSKNGKTYPMGTNVQVMVYQPKFYYKTTPISLEDSPWGIGQRFLKGLHQISEYQYNGFKVHPAFVRNGKELPYILLSAYEGVLQKSNGNYETDLDFVRSDPTTDRMSSIAGADPIRSAAGGYSPGQAQRVKYTCGDFRTIANNRGGGWQCHDILALSVSQLLFLIEYATINAQTAIGKGRVTPIITTSIMGSKATKDLFTYTGFTSFLGNKSGKDTEREDGYNSVSYRGEENLWSNTHTFLDGINWYRNSVGTSYWADHDFADGKTDGSYQPVGFNVMPNACGQNGYSSECDFLFLPNGSSITKDTDWSYGHHYLDGIAAVTQGFVYNTLEDYYDGLFSYDLAVETGFYYPTVGARLLCIPDETAEEE